MTPARAPLNDAALSHLEGIPVPGYDRATLRPGIAHFGVGNFHRAHQAVYVDRYLRQSGDVNWGIVGIGVSDGDAARRKAAVFTEQDYLYTLTEFDPSGAATSRVIGAMTDYLLAPREPERVLDLLASPSLHLVTLTITEGGYFLETTTGAFAGDRPEVLAEFESATPSTVFGFLVRALERRRDRGVAPFTVVSCDNLPHNGNVARTAVLGFAARRDPRLAQWIEDNVAFPNSMVDRVVPYVSPATRDDLNERTGLDDALAVTGESYLQWVLENKFSDVRPALEEVGVQIVDDVTPYETLKLRLLNAPHVLLSYPAVLAGYRLVHEAMADSTLRALLERFVELDVIPILENVPADVRVRDYAHTIFERFGNPAIGDQLLRIATDGASKIPTFHAPITSRLVHDEKNVAREVLLLACYRRYLGGVDDRGERFEVTEPTLSAEDFAALRRENDPTPALRIPAFQPLGLGDYPAASPLLALIDTALDREGVIATIERYGLD